MTYEQASRCIERHMKAHGMGRYPHIFIGEAFQMAASALRSQSVKLNRSPWEECGQCKPGGQLELVVDCEWSYCPYCGRPLTEEAWAELERRIGGNDGTDT